MVFSGIPFLYFFLPVLLVFYFLLPDRAKNGCLLVFSLIFYASGEPGNIFLMLFTTLLAYIAAKIGEALLARGGPAHTFRRISLAVSLVLLFTPLFLFKYADFFLRNINLLFGADIPMTGASLPIGISFYTFQAVGYVIDVYRGDVRAERNYFRLTLYISLFPQLIAGPIVRYTDIAEALKSRGHSVDGVYGGVVRFSVGLGKKVLVANVLGKLASSLGASVLGGWLYALTSSLQIYYDFSGYSDMAIGLGRVFGFDFPENFNYPYISGSVAEFWRRWHISLGSWFRDYLYIPLGGNRVSFPRWVLNVLVVWGATGFWHGAEWNFIIWGLYFALFLIIEKVFAKRIARFPRFLRHTLTLLIVMFGFVIFDSSSVSELVSRLGIMFDFGKLSDPLSLYYAKSYALTLIAAVIGSTPLFVSGVRRLGDDAREIASPLFCSLILVVSSAYIINGSFNPFLYFRF